MEAKPVRSRLLPTPEDGEAVTQMTAERGGMAQSLPRKRDHRAGDPYLECRDGVAMFRSVNHN